MESTRLAVCLRVVQVRHGQPRCGLATPLTDVSPQSGHVLAVMVDLICAVLTVILAGTAIAVIGYFSSVTSTVEGIDGHIVPSRCHNMVHAKADGQSRG